MTLLETIYAYRAGNALYDTIPDAVTQQDEDAIVAATYGTPMAALVEWDQPAASYEEACEALRLAVEDNTPYSGSPVSDAMVRAALGYFDSHAAEKLAA